MSINKKLLNSDINNQVDILRYEQKVSKDVNSFLRALQKDLNELINKTDLTTGSETQKQKKLNALLKDANKLVEKEYGQIDLFTNKEYVEMMNFNTKYYQQSLNKAVGFTFSNKLTLEKIKKIAKSKLIQGSKSSTWWSNQGKNYQKRFEKQIKLGLAENETIGQLSTRFRRNVANISFKRAQSLVRTSVLEFSNTSKMETYRANDDVVSGIQWLATLDARTTVICISLDGLVWTLDLKPVGHSTTYPGNTAHWGCRSTQLVVLKDFDSIKNEKFKSQVIENGNKREFTGLITPHKSYQTWLREQSAEKQNDILGTWKAEQFRKGNIENVRDLTNMRSRPLTIKELKKKYDISDE